LLTTLSFTQHLIGGKFKANFQWCHELFYDWKH
jgi:hypothetical protein